MSKGLDLQLDIARRIADGAAGQGYANGRGFTEVPALFLKSIDQEKRQIRVLASSSALDRHGERILPEAFANSIAVFMQNPCVLAAHSHRLDTGEPPVIGRVVKIWIDSKGLWAVIEFAQTELAEVYWQLYSTGFMRAVSIGFIPKQGEYRQDENVRFYVHTEVELLEISCVAVPSNPEALVKDGGKQNAWLEQKKAEREDKNMRADGWPIFEDDGGKLARMLLTDDYDEGWELFSSDEDEGMNFAKLIKVGSCLDQRVAGAPRNCNQAASTIFEDACDLSAVGTFQIGERDRLAPHSKTEFENPFYEV